MPSKTPSVTFDVLLRAPDAAGEAGAKTVKSFKPDPEIVERCRRWLAARGVTCHAGNFSIACSAPPMVFAELFGTEVRSAGASGSEEPGIELTGEIHVPAEIADLIEQVTLTRPPEFFP